MRLTSSIAPLLCLCLPLIACGDEDTPNDATDTVTDISEIETSGDADATQVTGEIQGTWAMLETQTALAEVLPEVPQEQLSLSYYLATLNDGAMTVTLCDWTTDALNGQVKTTMRPATIASFDSFERGYTVTHGDAGVVGFEAAQGVTLRGVTLDAPLDEALPTSADDERVVDQDEDGHPGITLIVQGLVTGELYVIHRHKAALAGTLESDTRISGRTTWTTDQVILGASSETLAAQDPKPQTHPDPAKSTFVMVKVDPGDDCAAIIARRAALFP